MANKWITSQEIKANTLVGGNVDPDHLTPLIVDNQVMVFEPLLGTKLFDKIDADFGSNSLAGVYSTMFTTWIKPALWHSVHADYLRSSNLLIRNAGTFTHNPENATPAKLEEIIYAANTAQGKADVYLQRLITYLRDQKANIPEYTTNQDNDYDNKPDSTVSTLGGWYLGGDNLDCIDEFE